MKGNPLYILLWLSLILCFACSPGKKEKKYVIGVSQCSMTDIWRQSMIRDMEVEALNHPEIELVVMDAIQDNDTQISQIKGFIKKKVDLLIISSNETEPVTPVAVEAYRAGIPTIILDRKINSDEYTTYIGADNYEIGRSIGMYVSSLIKKETTILEIWGRRGSSSATERHQGFVDAMSIDPNVKIRELDGYWYRKNAYEEVLKLDSIEDVDIVFAHNDMMALGAREAIEERDSSLVEHVEFIGVDGLLGGGLGVEAVAQGKLDASFYYPTGGGVAIKVAWQILSGQAYTKKYALSTAMIDKTNAGTLYLQSDRLVEYQRQIEKQRANLSQLLSKYNFLYSSLIIILILALLLGGSAIYTVYINRKVRQKNHLLNEKNRLVQQQKEELSVANQRIEQVTTQKLQFFTNVSHEIKTPLTLILGPLNKMAQDAPAGAFADDIRIVKKNAERLKRVIDQLLDFRKIENNKMGLRVTKMDLVFLIQEVKSYFNTLAQSKRIDYTFLHEMDSLFVWVDTDKMEKILTNLLSNAFKFTPEQGKITIRLREEETEVVLSVEDNGEGIPPENLASVFERFFTSGQSYAPGTGIGLHLTREFVLMHKGSIHVESEQGERTVFTVQIPKGKSHFDESCVFLSNATESSSGVAHLDISQVQETLNKKYDYTILIVEDDWDICAYLQHELSGNFNVLVAENGAKALDILLKENVSLVVSDVMMPEMNGFELCRRVKSDMALSHIPVILLTALSDDSQRLYGFEGGADEYIHKPFNIEIVKLRIIKLLEERNRLREVFLKESQSPAGLSIETKGKVESLDDLFMRKFIALIEENYSDPDFSIEKGSEKLGLSRVHLYRKVKELSGITPTDFLRNYRLKKASALLKQRSGTISEVAYATGFGSPAYFSKCFKAVYNITPTEFIESL